MPISPSSPGATRLVLGGIEDDDRIGRERNADGDRLVRRQFGQRRGDGRLGRAVGIEDAAARAIPARHEVLRAGLAADQQDAQLRQVLLDGREQRRAAGHDGDAALAQEVGEFVADQRRARPRRDERRAGHQRHPDFLDREVEGDGHALIDAVARRVAVKLGGDAHEIADAGVRDGDALRIAGRAGGVDDVAERIERRRHAGHRIRRPCASIARLRLVEEDLLDVERREALLEARHRDDRADLGVADDEADALDRETRRRAARRRR